MIVISQETLNRVDVHGPASMFVEPLSQLGVQRFPRLKMAE